jgi:hypothetical protein
VARTLIENVLRVDSSSLFGRLYRDLTQTGIPPGGIHFCISPVDILPSVRAAGIRIV